MVDWIETHAMRLYRMGLFILELEIPRVMNSDDIINVARLSLNIYL